MRRVRLLTLVMLSFIAVTPAATKPAAKKKKEEPPPKFSKEAKERILRAANPGPQHKVLGSFVGSWDESIRNWKSPKDKPEPTTGTSEVKWILGGRFIEQTFSGVTYGQKVDGFGLMGFDTLAEKFISHWYDTLSTSELATYGTYDATNKVINLSGTSTDPATGQAIPVRAVLRLIDENTHVYELYMPQKNGLELKTLEIVSHRRKM